MEDDYVSTLDAMAALRELGFTANFLVMESMMSKAFSLS